MFISSNPSTGKRIFTQDIFSDQQVLELIERSNAEYLKNRCRPMEERINLLNRLIDELRKNKKELSSLITEEIGKPINQSMSELNKCIDLCIHYAGSASDYLKDEEIETDNFLSKICFQPLGVIFGIMPWNFPFWQVFRFVIPTMLAGNTVVIKHAPNAVRCSLAIADLFDKAGFGSTYQNMFASTGQCEFIIKDRAIKGVSLTGSCNAGSVVGALTSKYLKPQILELGGSDVFIVNDTDDMAQVVGAAVNARLQNNGQSCIASKRFLIKESLILEFKRLLVQEVNKIKIGPPESIETTVGPLAREDLKQEFIALLKKGKEQGAEVITENKHRQSTGFYVDVSVLEVFDGTNCLMEEEVFGPCFVLKSFKDIDEAIEITNNSFFGLSSSIWTNDDHIKSKCINGIEAGAVFINRISKSDPKLPFGGVKDSGIGRELGEEGIKAFVNKKLIVE